MTTFGVATQSKRRYLIFVYKLKTNLNNKNMKKGYEIRITKNNLDTSKLNYIMYCRKSSESEDKQVQSLDTQYRELTEYAKKNNLNIVKIIQESKSAFSVGRDGFNEMINSIKNKEANAILVVRANRISRNSMDSAETITLMDEKKLLYVRTPSSSCYTCFGNDKFMLGLEFIVSKKDSDDKGDSVIEGQTTKALKGYPHGVATLGFLNDKSEEKGNRKWLVDEDRIWKIEKLLKMFLTGTWSAGKLHRYAVNDLKLTTVKRRHTGGGFITLSRIYEILTDSIYAGFFYYGGERYELNKDLPRLITEAEHNKIKQLLARNNIPKTQHHDTPYAGFIKSDKGESMGVDVKFQLICDCKNKFAYRDKTHCPACGISIEEMENPKYLHKIYYYNVPKKKNQEKYKSVEINTIENQLKDLIENHLNFSDDLINWSKKYIYELRDKEVSEKVKMDKDREIRKEEYEIKKSKLRALLRDGKINDEEYDFDLKQLDKEYSDIKIENQNKNWFKGMTDILKIAEESKDIFNPESDIRAKKEILVKLGSNLVWNEEKLFIFNRKEIDILINGVKEAKAKNTKFEPKLNFDLQGLNEKTEPLNPVFSTMLRGQGSNLRPIG